MGSNIVMLYSRKIIRNLTSAISIVCCLLLSTSVIQAQGSTDSEKSKSEIVQVALPNSPAQILLLSGISLNVKEYRADKLQELAPEMAAIFPEYRVVSAASAESGRLKIDVIQTQNQFAAFGLFSLVAGPMRTQAGTQTFGSNSARINGGLVFWKGNVFVRLRDATLGASNVNSSARMGESAERIARTIAGNITTPNVAAKYPPLLDSLPQTSMLSGSEQYFLGPESLNSGLERGREMFEFTGDTEAVKADYEQAAGLVSDTPAAASNKPQGAALRTAPEPNSTPLTLIIVECHTPEFATDELARMTNFVSSLPESDQQQIVFKRTGNYIVAGVNVRDREFAEGLINSVQYPYTVKWLRNPLWPTNDPFRTQKAAQMLLSTFGLLGLIILTVLLGGSIFGASVFLRRRKQQREIFSDAGGMLRLDIEPFALALPPKRDN